MLDDDAGHGAIAERDAHARTDTRKRDPIGDGVRQEIEKGNWNSNADEGHVVTASPPRTAARERASYLPRRRAWRMDFSAGTPGDRSESGSRHGTRTHARGCA